MGNIRPEQYPDLCFSYNISATLSLNFFRLSSLNF